MKSVRRGANISAVEVVHISNKGFWIFLRKEKSEHFIPFRLFPWFKKATIEELCDVAIEGRTVLHWNALDVDLDIARIDHPEQFPLVSRKTPNSRSPKSRKVA